MMINPIIYVRRLLSVRLSLWIVLFAALIFIGALKYLFTESKETVREEAINHANQILDTQALKSPSVNFIILPLWTRVTLRLWFSRA